MRRTALPFAACLALLATACAGGVADPSADDATTGSPIPEKARIQAGAITVEAEWRRVSDGVPTYGYTPTADLLRIEVVVSDDAIRAEHHGFDGLESAFALVPRQTDDGLVWESHAVPFHVQSRRGDYAQEVIDIHATDWMRGVDVDAARTHGIAIGLDTNVGTIWAQGPGENHPVVEW